MTNTIFQVADRRSMETDNNIYGQQKNQKLKPPGMVHIKNAEQIKKLVNKLPVRTKIGSRIFVLRDDRSR